jgi:hypothetical protein
MATFWFNCGKTCPLRDPAKDFVFGRKAEGRVIKCLTIVEDAKHEAVAIEVERAISITCSPGCSIAWRSVAASPT